MAQARVLLVITTNIEREGLNIQHIMAQNS